MRCQSFIKVRICLCLPMALCWGRRRASESQHLTRVFTHSTVYVFTYPFNQQCPQEKRITPLCSALSSWPVSLKSSTQSSFWEQTAGRTRWRKQLLIQLDSSPRGENRTWLLVSLQFSVKLNTCPSLFSEPGWTDLSLTDCSLHKCLIEAFYAQ